MREQKLHVMGWRKCVSAVFALLYVFVMSAIGLELESEVRSKGSGVLYLLS